MNLKDSKTNEVILPAACMNLNLIYPVGAIYMTVLNVNPADIFGGSWVKIENTFLLACGSTYAAGSTGGSETVTLTEENIPIHNHTVGAAGAQTTGAVGNHSHTFPIIHAVDYYKGGSARHGYHNSAGTSYNITSSSAGGHPDTVPAHSHTITATGGGQAHNNMPPYLTVYMWRRTA